jgi:hypothetical protein
MSWRRTAPGHRTRGGGNGQLILPSTAKGRQGNALVHGRGLYRGDVDRGPRTGLDGFTPVLKDEKSNSVAEGYGQCTWPDGIHYEGEWRDGLPHGEGTQVFANGETYAGEWQRGIRHGFGQWCSREGHEYCGYWKDGLFHGQGQLWLQGGGGYWGPYERGNMHGMGLLAWPDGFVTMALFQHGLRHGNALEFLNEDWIAVRADAIYDRDRLVSRQPADVVKNGSVILDTEGRRAGRLVGGRAISFEEGKRARNRGVRAQLNDGGAYTGQIRLGRLDGRGKVVYWQGCEDKNDAIRSYEGLFCADKRHGVGIGKWDVSPYETVYAGAWQDGKPSGPGIMTWPDGTEYKGEFSEARPHGFGVLNVPGKFSVATGKMGPAVEICGIFHRGRPYIRADGQERAGFKGETEAIHLEIPSPRPVAELPISGRRTRSTRRSSGPHTPLKKDAEIHKAAIPDVVDMATQGKRNEEGLSDGREIKLDRLHAERHDELSSLHWKVDGFPQAQLQMKLAARNLKKMDGLFGKSDPYLVLKRAIVREKAHNDSVDTLSTVADDKKVESVQSMESTYLEHRKDGDTSMEAQLLGSTLPNEQEHIAIGTAVYRTEVVVDTLDPTWEEIVMPLESLCLEKHAPNDAFVIECWDYDKVSAPDLIGSVRTSISQIIASQTRELELALIDGNGKTGVGFLRILRAVVIGPTTCPPSLLTGESLKRLAHRASLIATSVADMTLWERGLDRQEGLLNASSVFQCMRPPGPMPERPIWRRNAIDDKEKQEALGLTAPITLKESVEAYNKEFEDELSADMLSLNPPPPPSRRRRPVTFAAAPPSHDSSSDDAGLMKINSSGEGGNARAGSAEDEVHEQREPQREEELEDRGIVDVDDLARKEPLEEMLEESEQKREGSSQTECQDEQDARSEGIGGGGDDKSVVESEGSQWGDDGALLGGNISEWVRLDEAEGACADVTARNDNLQCVSEIQKEDGEEAQEMEEIVQNLEPRKLEVTVVTARDVPVKSYAPAGSGLYVVIEFQDQVYCTFCMTRGVHMHAQAVWSLD